MKNKLAQFLMLVALTVGFSVFANAQSGTSQKINIPFDFIVGEKSFPAGEYNVKFGISPSAKDNLLLRSTDGKQSAIISQTIGKINPEIPEEENFVFYVFKGHYYLAEINTAQRSVEIISSHLKKMPKNRKYQFAPAR